MHSNREVSATNSENDCHKKVQAAIYQHQTQGYPVRPNRYGLFSTNFINQECYTSEEISLLDNIKHLHQSTAKNHDAAGNYFEINSYSSVYGIYSCLTPEHPIPELFTLPTQEAQDDKLYPIFDLSHSVARQIANMQAERVAGQNPALMNDPNMLALEELKNWFLVSLAASECNQDALDNIASKKTYLKNLFYEVTDFGKDKSNLREIESHLSFASTKIHQCMAQQQTPELLRDLVRSSKNLESIISNYLHFLLIDEPVSDNFIGDLTQSSRSCDKSPICHIFNGAKANPRSIITNSQIMSSTELTALNGQNLHQISLNYGLLEGIKFAEFVTQSDKNLYLETVSHLELISGIRESLQEFNNLQTKLGSYNFALVFIKNINDLAENYLKLIEEAKSNIFKLLEIANKGIDQLLSRRRDNKNPDFMRNLRLLETKIAKDDTAKNKLQTKTQLVRNSMHQYQKALQTLVLSIESGEASQEIDHDIQQLSHRIHRYNYMVRAILQHQNYIEEGIVATKPQLETDIANVEQVANFLETCPASPIEKNNQNSVDFFRWSEKLKQHPDTGEDIFTFQAYKDSEVVGEIELYAEARLCISENSRRTNIIESSGIFSDFDPLQVEYSYPICEHLPPTLLEKSVYESIDSARIGFARGVGTSIGKKAEQLGYSKPKSILANQLAFISLTMGTKFAENYYYKGVSDPISALIISSIETGEVFIANTVISSITTLLSKGSNFCKSHGYNTASSTLNTIASIIPAGLFFNKSYNQGFIPAFASTAAGLAADQSANSVMSHFLEC